jgi:hypothetical protein
MAAKHFLIYYHKGAGTFVVTEPRPWARENQELFPTYNFDNNIPNVTTIENWLIDNRNFRRMIDNEEVVVIQNLDPDSNL